MNPPPGSPLTISGWAFGRHDPVPLASASPALLPRRQIPLIGTSYNPSHPSLAMRPRELFPVSGIRLTSASRHFAVADPNAPPGPPHMIPAATAPAPPAAVEPVETFTPPDAPGFDPSILAALQARIEFLEAQQAHEKAQMQALQSHTQAQLQSAQAQAFAASAAAGTSRDPALPHFLHPSLLSGPGSSSLGVTPSCPDPQLPPVGSRGAAPKLPVPESIKDSTIKKFRSDPEALNLCIERIFEYIMRTGLRYPHDIQSFIQDLDLLKWVRSYFEANGAAFDQNAFIAALVTFITGEVRPRSVIALQEIMGHQVTQGTQSAAQYSEQFYSRSRLLSHIPPVVLCHHFVSGLRPDLRKLCCVDREGRDWTSLHTLVAFTIVEERRLTMISSPPSDPDSSHHRKRGWRGQADEWIPANKRAKLAAVQASPASTDMEIETPKAAPPASYAAAVARREASQSGRPSGRPSSNGASPSGRPSSSGAGPSSSAGAGPSRLGPPEACPCYKLNNKGRPLAQWEQQCLSAYGLCWYCKASTEHSAKECPLKKKKSEGPQ